MPDQVNGKAAVVAAALPTTKNINATTNATPIVVTTSTAHSLKTGDVFLVKGATDAAANGVWLAGTVTSTTVVLTTYPGGTNSAGTGGGGAAGTLISLGPGPTVPIPSGSDPPKSMGFNTAFTALLADVAWLFYTVQYAIRLRLGGSILGVDSTTSITARAADLFFNGDFVLAGTAVLTAIAGSALEGSMTLGAGLTLAANAGAAITGALAISTTAIVQLLGRKTLKRARVILSDANHTISVADGDVIKLAGSPAAPRTTVVAATSPTPMEGETIRLLWNNAGAAPGAVHTITRVDTTVIATFTEGASVSAGACWMDVEWTSGAWHLGASSGTLWDALSSANYGVVPGVAA